MAVDRATQAVHAMDKFVVFVVLMVLSNHMVLFANAVHPRARFLFLHPIVAANTNSVQFVDEGSVKASKPQVLAQQAAAVSPTAQATNFKLQFVDSIFQIPIATLKAVNEFVQMVTKNYVTTGTLSGNPAKASVILVETKPIAASSPSSASSSAGVQATPASTNSVRSDAAAAAPAASPSPSSSSVSGKGTPASTQHVRSDAGSVAAASTQVASTASENKGVTAGPQIVGVTQ